MTQDKKNKQLLGTEAISDSSLFSSLTHKARNASPKELKKYLKENPQIDFKTYDYAVFFWALGAKTSENLKILLKHYPSVPAEKLYDRLETVLLHEPTMAAIEIINIVDQRYHIEGRKERLLEVLKNQELDPDLQEAVRMMKDKVLLSYSISSDKKSEAFKL